MTDIGPIISELIQVWRCRCGSCGDTQVVTKIYKADAEYVLTTMLGWKKTKTGWICRTCCEAAPRPLGELLRWDMDH